MTRAAFVLLFGSLTLMAQTSTNNATGIADRALPLKQAICGPIGIQARMVDASDMHLPRGQRVLITLNNTKSVEIVSDRITLHGIATSNDPSRVFGTESRGKIGARQEARLAIMLTDFSPISYVELKSARYADGSSWQPSEGEVCKIVPDPLRNQQ